MPWEWAARRGGRSQPAAEALAPSAASHRGRRPRTCRPLNPGCLPLCPRQVVDAKVVVDKPARGPLKPQKVAECTVGDASGVVLLTARNEQGVLRVWRCPACCCFCAAVCIPGVCTSAVVEPTRCSRCTPRWVLWVPTWGRGMHDRAYCGGRCAMEWHAHAARSMILCSVLTPPGCTNAGCARRPCIKAHLCCCRRPSEHPPPALPLLPTTYPLSLPCSGADEAR